MARVRSNTASHPDGTLVAHHRIVDQFSTGSDRSIIDNAGQFVAVRQKRILDLSQQPVGIIRVLLFQASDLVFEILDAGLADNVAERTHRVIE